MSTGTTSDGKAAATSAHATKAKPGPMVKDKNVGHLEEFRRAEKDAEQSGEKDPVRGDKNLLKKDANAPLRTDNSLHPDYKPNDPPQDPFDSVGANPGPEQDAANRSHDGPMHVLRARADRDAAAAQQGNDDD